MVLDLDSNEPIKLEGDAAEWLARFCPPDGMEGHRIVDGGDFVYFKHPDDIQPDDLICFYDGDMRKVLLPDDPRVKELLRKE